MANTCCSIDGMEIILPVIDGFDVIELRYALDKARRVQAKLPRKWTKVARFLAIIRPFMEVFVRAHFPVFRMKHQAGMPGVDPVRPEAVLLLHLLAHLGTIGSYRQVSREVALHDDWMKALQIVKVPDHTTLCRYRKKWGEETFKEFFRFSVHLLDFLGCLKGDTVVIADSAPVEARVNFARANKRVDVDEARVLDFLAKMHLERADELYPRKRDGGYKASSMIGLLLLHRLCNFLSRSKLLKDVAGRPAVLAALGLEDGVPVQATISYFVKVHGNGDENAVLAPFVNDVVRFFEEKLPGDSGKDLDLVFFLGMAEQDPGAAGS